MRHLSLNFGSRFFRSQQVDATLLTEEMFTSFELAADLPTSAEQKFALHHAIACRTIISAARSGHLRQLVCAPYVNEPFAIPALLPYWVRIDTWSLKGSLSPAWMGAAVALRHLLFHASHWLGTKEDSEPRSTLKLTRQDVQVLRSQLKGISLPVWADEARTIQRVEPYLPWLEEDADLAQDVSDAWNEIVKRREVNNVKCLCGQCQRIESVVEKRKAEWLVDIKRVIRDMVSQ